MWCVDLLHNSPTLSPTNLLAKLFRRSCPGRLIIVILNDQPASDADVVISTSDGPDAIVRALHVTWLSLRRIPLNWEKVFSSTLDYVSCTVLSRRLIV
jgi:hypothetical protein